MGHGGTGTILVTFIGVLPRSRLLLPRVRCDQPRLIRPSARLETGLFDKITTVERGHIPLFGDWEQGRPGGAAQSQHARRQEILPIKRKHDFLRI